MPYTPDEIVAQYQAGSAAYGNGKKLAAHARRLWDAVQAPGQLGSVGLRDSARRRWAVDVRREAAKGRYLQFRPVAGDLERIRASADGYQPEAYLPIRDVEWTAFALFAAGEHDGSGHVEDEELTLAVSRLADAMVRAAQHAGLSYDGDDE